MDPRDLRQVRPGRPQPPRPAAASTGPPRPGPGVRPPRRRPLPRGEEPRGLGQFVEIPAWLGPSLIALGVLVFVSVLWRLVCGAPTRASTADAILEYLGQPLQQTSVSGNQSPLMVDHRQRALDYHKARRLEDLSMRPIEAGSVWAATGQFVVQVSVVNGDKRVVRYFRVQHAGCFRQPIVERELTALTWQRPVL